MGPYSTYFRNLTCIKSVAINPPPGGGGGSASWRGLGCVFKNFSFALGPIFKFLSILGHNCFRLSALGLSKWGIVSALGCQK